MWSKRRSFLLLVQVKQSKKAGLIIPLALPVLESTLRSWRDSLEIWEGLFPGLNAWLWSQSRLKTSQQLRLSQLFTWCIRLLDELRQYGTYKLVNLKDDRNHVSIRLW